VVAADIPVRPRQPGTQAIVFLVGESQSYRWDTVPNHLLAVVASKDRVTLALKSVTAFANGETCRKQVAALEDKDAPDSEVRATYMRCWSAALERSPGKPALMKAAQELVEALETR
jgi:hypothetical protein